MAPPELLLNHIRPARASHFLEFSSYARKKTAPMKILKEGFLRILKKYQVPYDERYLWH